MSDTNNEELIAGLAVAMMGTEDGDFIDPNDEIPAGEMLRLATEYLEAALSFRPPVPAESSVTITRNGQPIPADDPFWVKHESNCGVFDDAVDRDCDCDPAPVTPQVTSDPTWRRDLEIAMLGTTDGDFIDPNSEIPAGEMLRLASEFIEARFASCPSVEGEGDTAKHVRHRDIHGDRSNDINGPWFCCAYVQLGGIGMNDCNECGEPFPCSAVVSVEGEGPTPGGIPDLTEAEASAYWEALHPSVEGEREATQDEAMAAIPTLYLDKADDAHYIAEALLERFSITRKETKQ